MTFLPLLFAVYSTEDDRSLAERLKRHEPTAMAELYDRYCNLAYSLICRIVRDVGAVARNRAIDYVRSAGGKTARFYVLE